MSKEIIIQVDSLVKKYNEVTAIKGATFTVNQRKAFSFVGPKGAGRTKLPLSFSRTY